MNRLASIVISLALVSVCFSIHASEDAKADFMNTMAVPWPSTFTPLDSAWEPTGNHAIVVGNDSAGNSNAWHYNAAVGQWAQAISQSGGGGTLGKRTLHVGAGTGNYSTTIQAAIDAAKPGDTVFVWSGTYFENIYIDKALNLTGGDRTSTIIDGQSLEVVRFSSDWVNMTGFTIRNGGNLNPGLYMDSVNNCLLYNNRITGNENGIHSYFSNHNVIRNNIITSNFNNGIYLTDSTDNLIERNNITSNTGSGIVVNWADDNAIRYNDVTSNGFRGVYLWSSGGTLIHNNNIMFNADYQGYDNTGMNTWNLAKNQGGGNHWGDWTSPDGGDGFVTVSRTIDGAAGAMDQYPWVLENGWVGEVVVDGLGGINRRVNDDLTSTIQQNPSIAIDDFGVIYAAWDDTRLGTADIFFSKSLDGGITFGSNIRVNDATANTQSNPTIACNPSNGYIYIAWKDERLSAGNPDIYFARSLNGGVTFESNIRVNDVTTGTQDSPRIAVSRNGDIYVVWTDWRDGNGDIYFAKSNDGGMNFGPNIRVNDDALIVNQIRPSIATDSSQNVYVVWEDPRNGNSDIYFARSTNRGASFEANIRVNDDAGSKTQAKPSITVDQNGIIYFAWNDNRLVDYDVFFSRSTDGGITFMANMRLDSGGTSNVDKTSIATGPDGCVYVVWQDNREGTYNLYIVKSTNQGVTFSTDKKFTPDNTVKIAPSLAVNPAGEVFCAWTDTRNTDNDVYFARYIEFTSIQPAINAARPMWTVRVMPGTYTENVNVNKQISLVGSGRDATIIDASGAWSAVNVTASGARVAGFTMQNSGANAGGIFLDTVSDCTVENNWVTANDHGILLGDSSNNIITGNLASNNQNGICLTYSPGNSFQYNVVSQNTADGFYIDWSDNNIVKDNEISSNNRGFYIYQSGSTTISGNTVSYNTNTMHISSKSGHIIYRNNFIGNTNMPTFMMAGAIWDQGDPASGGLGGNHWSHYTAPDDNGDGIVDAPLTLGVPGGTDNYPWVLVDGWLRQFGSGTTGDPYLIHDVWELQAMKYDLTAHYALANDIDASVTASWNLGEGFEPIATFGIEFSGSLDGRGYAITGLIINRPTQNIVGMICYAYDSEIRNICLLDADITGNSPVGGLVGLNYGTIVNCQVTGSVMGTDWGVGGLVGENYGSITYSHSSASVSTGQDTAGGLVGANYGSGSISKCYATGHVSVTIDTVGGLVGLNSGAIDNSFASGDVVGSVAGGLVGHTSGSISRSYSTGTVTGAVLTGGLVGYRPSGDEEVAGCFWDTDTSGQTFSDGGTGLTTAQMKTQATFTAAGWDFTSVWWMEEGVTYPYLLPMPGASGEVVYNSINSVIWDNVGKRFWLCGENKLGAASTVFYIEPPAFTAMVPVEAPSASLGAIAADDLGGVMLAGSGLGVIYYFDGITGHELVEADAGTMSGWNITSITFNPNDDRFYLVGNAMNQDRGVAFFTDPLPLTSASKCYLDNSDFISSPGIGSLRSISWNPIRNYGLAVGDGVYRVNQWDGLPENRLSWSVIGTPQAGRAYHDISWDSDGWNEAGLVGADNDFGTYWRYYHTNPHVLDGYTDPVMGTKYVTCTMKPPSSPKWLLVPASGGAFHFNIEESYRGGYITLEVHYPHIFSVEVFKSNDFTQTSMLNRQAIDGASTYSFQVEGNYTVSGIDLWDDLDIEFSAWLDGGSMADASQPGDPTWASADYRTRQFNITYHANTGSAAVNYPVPAGSVAEFSVHSCWEDPVVYGAEMRHRLLVNITFGHQAAVADGDGFANGAALDGNIWSKTNALNDPWSWDMRVDMHYRLDRKVMNRSYEEFGIKQYISIYSTGNPSGSAPPGAMNILLSNPTSIYYSSNTVYRVSVSIPDLHLNGDEGIPNPIPAGNIQAINAHTNAIGNSDMSSLTNFPGAGQPLYVWGMGALFISAAPHGNQSAGPGYSDYSGEIAPPFEVTVVEWWVQEVPVGLAEGIYRATITLTIGN
jgi:parallel beta-helix repeat protein